MPAHKLGALQSKGIADIAELDDALAALKQGGSRTFIVQPSPFTYGHRGHIIASAMKIGLGTISAWPVSAKEGALIGYGPDYVHMYSTVLRGSRETRRPPG
jgi:hypothetical protein